MGSYLIDLRISVYRLEIQSSRFVGVKLLESRWALVMDVNGDGLTDVIVGRN